jgi:dolichol kinase
METAFFQNQLAEFIILHIIAFCEGLMVVKGGVKVNYTRKINHFFVFFLPFIVKIYIPFTENLLTMILMVCISMATFIIYLKPVRTKAKLFGMMYAAFDRPEDRPHTMKWLFTQYLATYMVAVPLYFYFHHIGKPQFLMLIILVNAIGDGLAEPVGVTWGRHKYKVRALFTRQTYTRSIEGSACVFITAVLVLLGFHHLFTAPQLIAALLLFPIGVTLAEAYSPHTWDSPFIFLVGGLILIAIINVDATAMTTMYHETVYLVKQACISYELL